MDLRFIRHNFSLKREKQDYVYVEHQLTTSQLVLISSAELHLNRFRLIVKDTKIWDIATSSLFQEANANDDNHKRYFCSKDYCSVWSELM